ncbi:MAG: Pyruvate,phosphate dikinase [Candidatus Carbobacillus altaicus]|uniref:Pyruvate, phosphate dikinase n=1 Tax=Candidatus Carbonibacillus altaicus TaxID=2163959 RepID=A0A2R6Y319_9BACL|nr:MAG: Pyruvate,phosphate dikinase [Candidatus Carbobacillus altaicus]
MKKYVYHFHEGDQSMKGLLGGKGANLAEMTRVGLPVPPGFTITTEACLLYYEQGERLPDDLVDEIFRGLAHLMQKTGKTFGDPRNPLLVSVRSGAAISMPGMMDTILNLGLNDETVKGLAHLTQNSRFAYDAYRRFIQMFSDVVLGIPHYLFEEVIEKKKKERGVSSDPELTAEDWQSVIASFLAIVQKESGRAFPQDPKDQLLEAVRAVFRSWNNQRAIVYRKIHKIPDDLGTAVNVQSMVFGNMGNDSGTGVAFTRNPSTGEKELYGEFLLNAQGEDVVAGIRTPQPIASLEIEMPAVYAQFREIAERLERHYRDMQDIEFTVERGTLYLLQTRNGKRTAQAAVNIAVDMVEEGLIDRRTALMRIEPAHLDQLLHRRIDERSDLKVLVKGLPASPGAAAGEVVFDADEAAEAARDGRRVILVRPETTPEDIHGIVAAEAVVTSRGGMTSHAAVVARGMGKACVAGVEAIEIDLQEKVFRVGDTVVREGDVISVDGSKGTIMLGEVPLVEAELSPAFQTLLSWADEVRALGVRANADTPQDAALARSFGAEGIGLCRTEHMFMAPERVPLVQKMILAGDDIERRTYLEQLRPLQEEDFYGILKAMAPYPVTIRLLDPPLHEFLPNYETLLLEVDRLEREGRLQSESAQEKLNLLRKVRQLREANPMLGLRGCRLGIIHPDIYAMQVEAIFRAATRLITEGVQPAVEIMIPLVGDKEELLLLRKLVDDVYARIYGETGVTVSYLVGTMIELPRAALTADRIAEVAEFFSFGTNDLTQTTFGYSRDDAEGKFLHHYLEHKILPDNPFAVLDEPGVGKLIEIGVELGKKTRPSLKTGICGEHGGDAQSIDFCHRHGLDYVSASPYRVPLARLSAAQAALRHTLSGDESTKNPVGTK